MLKHLNHLNIQDQLVKLNRNKEIDQRPERFSHQPVFALWKGKFYFGQIRDIHKDPCQTHFTIFTKSIKKNGTPLSSDPNPYNQIFLCQDLSEEQKKDLFSKIRDQINRVGAEEFLIYGILPDFGEDHHILSETNVQLYLNQVVKVNTGRKEGAEFALVVAIRADKQQHKLHVMWLLTKHQLMTYAKNPECSRATRQEIDAAVLEDHELLITGWIDTIHVESIHSGPVPVYHLAGPDIPGSGATGYRCRYFCECRLAGREESQSWEDQAGSQSWEDSRSVVVKFDRRWMVQWVATHDGQCQVDRRAGVALGRWIEARARCEVRAVLNRSSRCVCARVYM
jgi:hypothetical protein